ncbi:hypothetical protein B0T20DRAFT_466483 [Sordaria brevicollis]|uniref:Uncharacterized protein n=1 Tax=Sordaria brevicollis TaxID=83679 RepID=A0AAE0UES3_SORBR|nr:hypothetical protein B0T20DRAFT_466483 [Sordaria brevicollis]
MATEKQSVQDGKPEVEKDTKITSASSSSSHHSSSNNKNFRGQIFGPGILPSPTTPERAIATAGYALSKERNPSNLTSDHIWMVLFTGASCPKIRNPAGAYSVVAWHGKQPRMAWYMAPESEAGVAVTEKRLAGLAIAQALYIADERLRGLPESLKPKTVTIKIFSSCEETLREINDPSTIKEKGDERYSKKARLAVVRLIEDLSQSLSNIAGVERMRVYLQWLPTSYKKMQCARDFAKRCRRKSGGQDLYVIEERVKRPENMPEGVHKFIEEGVEDGKEEENQEETVVEGTDEAIAKEEEEEVTKKEERQVSTVEEEVAVAKLEEPAEEQSIEKIKAAEEPLSVGQVTDSQADPGEAMDVDDKNEKPMAEISVKTSTVEEAGSLVLAVEQALGSPKAQAQVDQAEIGRFSIGHVNFAEAMDLDDEMMDDEESTATERALNEQPALTNGDEQAIDDQEDLEDEQALIDQQLWADIEFSQSSSGGSSFAGFSE